jgi:hypothetical protein
MLRFLNIFKNDYITPALVSLPQQSERMQIEAPKPYELIHALRENTDLNLKIADDIENFQKLLYAIKQDITLNDDFIKSIRLRIKDPISKKQDAEFTGSPIVRRLEVIDDLIREALEGYPKNLEYHARITPEEIRHKTQQLQEYHIGTCLLINNFLDELQVSQKSAEKQKCTLTR